MAENRPLREALEAVRGDDQMTSPELAELRRALDDSVECREAWEQLRRADAAIERALGDVPIPDGLEARLLARLAEVESRTGTAPAANCDSDAAGTAVAEETAVDIAPQRRSGFGRRLWWSVAAVVTVGACLAGFQAFRAGPIVDPEHLGFAAIGWQANLTDEWLDMSEPRPEPRPIDRQVRFAPRGWQEAPNRWDARSVAYDLSRREGAATLFVLAPTMIPAEVNVAATRVPATGGWGAAVWRNGDHLYVLVVQERGQKLDDYLRAAGREIVSTSSHAAPESAG